MRRCCDEVRCRGCQCGRALTALAIAAMVVTGTPGATTEHLAMSASAPDFLATPPPDSIAPAASVSVRVVPLELRRHPASAFGD